MRDLAFLMGALVLVAACGGGSSGSGTEGSSGTSVSSSGSSTGAGSGGGGAGGEGGAGSGGETGSGGAGGVGGGSGGAGGAGGGSSMFTDTLDKGVWLIGWAGGLDHFSWVRYTFLTPTQGSIDVLDSICVSCTPYFPCQGKGLFSADPAANEVLMQLPMACNNKTVTLTFSNFTPPGAFPPSATLSASITEQPATPLQGYQYPEAHCDAGFTTCKSPW